MYLDACSFCRKAHRDVRALVGTPNQATKICDECVGLCCDILGEEVGVLSPRDVHSYAAPNFDDEEFQQHVGEILQRLAAERETSRHEALLGDLRRSFTPGDKAFFETFRCSFCDADRRDVAKLISGPRVFICDRCVCDAADVVSHVMRAS